MLNVKVEVRGLLERISVSSSAILKPRIEESAVLSESIMVSNALDVILLQGKLR
ncbi:hypothetical protein ACFVHQ_00285 [Actinomycetes bacterium NPDC127524]